MSADIMKQIDLLVESKTFNLDALEGIKQIKDSLKQTLDERDSLKQKCIGLNETNIRQGDLLQERSDVINELRKELEEAKALNAAGQKSIYDADKHQAVADAWKSAMAMVFKPSAVRETIQRNHSVMVSTPNGGSYPQSVANQDHIVREDA
jgi:hypothetical protein